MTTERAPASSQEGQLSFLEICLVFVLGVLIVVVVALSFLGRLGPIELLLFGLVTGSLIILLSLKMMSSIEWIDESP